MRGYEVMKCNSFSSWLQAGEVCDVCFRFTFMQHSNVHLASHMLCRVSDYGSFLGSGCEWYYSYIIAGQ